MRNLPKSQRNIRIWLEKEGFKSETDMTVTKEPKTFRKLSFDYNLSIPRLLVIINRERKAHGKLN
jgi:hypothetical protein